MTTYLLVLAELSLASPYHQQYQRFLLLCVNSVAIKHPTTRQIRSGFGKIAGVVVVPCPLHTETFSETSHVLLRHSRAFFSIPARVLYVCASLRVSRNLSLFQIHRTKSGAAEQQAIRPRTFSNNLRKIGEKFRRGRQVTSLAPAKSKPLFFRSFFFLRRTLAESNKLFFKHESNTTHLLCVLLLAFLTNARPGTQRPMARRTPTNF